MTRTEDEGSAILPDIAEAINGKLEQHGIEKEQVLGIGVGVPAPVTVDGIVNGSANLGWKYKNAKKELEELTGLTAEFGNARKKMEHETRATILTKEDLSAKAVFDAVKEGDEVAIEVATEMGNYLGHAMADMAAVLDPAVFVIGGGVSKAGEVLLSFIEKPFMEKAFFANKNVKFKLATLGNDAGICGAAKLVLED